MKGCGVACVYAEVFLLILGLGMCEPTKFAGLFYFLDGWIIGSRMFFVGRRLRAVKPVPFVKWPLCESGETAAAAS